MHQEGLERARKSSKEHLWDAGKMHTQHYDNTIDYCCRETITHVAMGRLFAQRSVVQPDQQATPRTTGQLQPYSLQSDHFASGKCRGLSSKRAKLKA